MKQIYYLATSDKEHRFDSIFETVEGVAVFYDIEKIPSLVSFIQRERAITNQNFLVIDLQGAEFSNAHILSAVQFLRKLSVAELVFIGEDNESTTQLFGNLSANFRMRSLLVDSDEAGVLKKLEDVLLERNSPLAFTENILAKEIKDVQSAVRQLNIPEGLVISVGVAGALGRCGTTTQVLALARLFNSIGFKTAIHDADGKLAKVVTACYRDEMEMDEWGDLHLFGLAFCQQWREQYTAYIRDYGVLTQEVAPLWAESDISILVTTTKLWELDSVVPAVRLSKQASPQCFVGMASFSDEAQMEALSPVLGDMMLLPWRPDVWDTTVPGVYTDTFLPLLRIACGNA